MEAGISAIRAIWNTIVAAGPVGILAMALIAYASVFTSVIVYKERGGLGVFFGPYVGRALSAIIRRIELGADKKAAEVGTAQEIQAAASVLHTTVQAQASAAGVRTSAELRALEPVGAGSGSGNTQVAVLSSPASSGNGDTGSRPIRRTRRRARSTGP